MRRCATGPVRSARSCGGFGRDLAEQRGMLFAGRTPDRGHARLPDSASLVSTGCRHQWSHAVAARRAVSSVRVLMRSAIGVVRSMRCQSLSSGRGLRRGRSRRGVSRVGDARGEHRHGHRRGPATSTMSTNDRLWNANRVPPCTTVDLGRGCGDAVRRDGSGPTAG